MGDSFADYQRAGWALCKIKPREKGAFEKGWSSREGAYTDPDSLGAWRGGAGLLHAFSGTCAIDIDNLKLAIPALASQGIDLPGLLRAPGCVSFWRGDPNKLKLLFALPEPIVGVARNGHGFDFRCMAETGGSQQDVLPPSIHESGEAYRWLKGDWRTLPPLPDNIRHAWVRAKALWPEDKPGPKTAPAAASGLTAAAMVGAADSAFEGNRNEWLSGQLYAYLKRGGDYDGSLEWLRRLNAEKCSPPEDDDKVYKIWRGKSNIEPDPIVIPPSAGALPGTEDLVFETKPELPYGYEWDGDWIYRTDPAPRALLSDGPLWVNRVLRTISPDGTEVRTAEVMTGAGRKLIPATELVTAADKTFVNYGIYSINESAKAVRTYLVKSMKHCEQKGLIVDTYGTFGWHGDNFLVGDLLFSPGKAPQTVALTQALLPLAEGMKPAPFGSLAAWRGSALDMIHPGNMSQAFGFLMGMAAPLMKLSGERGGMYSLLGESGQGKSSVQNALCTVWGDPAAFHTRADDTANARMIKLSYLSNLPMVAEELTKMEPHELSNLAYSVSEGRDKDRANQDGGLRVNVGAWHTLVVSSSNRSLLDAILMADGDAAAYRILEDTVSLPKGAKQSDGDRIMRALVANQGHAGFVFAQYLVDHKDAITSLIRRTVAELSDTVSASTKERIRINMLACALVAGAMLKATGVLPVDVKAFREYGIEVLRRNMGSQAENAVGFADVLQGFIDSNQASVLRMKGDSALNVISIQGRAGPLMMRYDVLAEELYVHQSELHKYVQERKQSWADFVKWMEVQGYLKRRGKHVLSKGSGLPSSPQVNVLVLDNLRMGVLDATEDSRSSLTIAAMA